jgi:hypothetical protein
MDLFPVVSDVHNDVVKTTTRWSMKMQLKVQWQTPWWSTSKIPWKLQERELHQWEICVGATDTEPSELLAAPGHHAVQFKMNIFRSGWHNADAQLNAPADAMST